MDSLLAGKPVSSNRKQMQKLRFRHSLQLQQQHIFSPTAIQKRPQAPSA